MSLYLASLAGAILVIGLFVSHESGQSGLWRPWRVVVLAWRSPLSFLHWVKYAGICLVPLTASLAAIPVSVRIVGTGWALYRLTVAGPAHLWLATAARGLKGYYGVTALPGIWLGAAALSAISLRCLGSAIMYLPCCVTFIAALMFIAPLACFIYVSAAPTWCAGALISRAFGIPAP